MPTDFPSPLIVVSALLSVSYRCEIHVCPFILSAISCWRFGPTKPSVCSVTAWWDRTVSTSLTTSCFPLFATTGHQTSSTNLEVLTHVYCTTQNAGFHKLSNILNTVIEPICIVSLPTFRVLEHFQISLI